LALANGIGRLVIECKRDDADWLFIIPKKSFWSVSRFRLAWLSRESSAILRRGHTDFRVVTPESFESEFCVTTDPKQQKPPALEPIARDLVAQTDALAMQEFALGASREPGFAAGYMPSARDKASLGPQASTV
jgi:hypothetical protein